MLFGGHYFQVLQSIVQSVTVDVVNYFTLKEIAPNSPFHDDPMLTDKSAHVLLFRCRWVLWRIDKAIPLVASGMRFLTCPEKTTTNEAACNSSATPQPIHFGEVVFPACITRTLDVSAHLPAIHFVDYRHSFVGKNAPSGRNPHDWMIHY